ncbi:MAG: ABC transporter permease [Defluviitaleaceae bacterium]|nr:ABC transporter permease [Defluviitaleaceae bacterium]
MKSLLVTEIHKLKQSKPVIGLLLLAFVMSVYVIPFINADRERGVDPIITMREAMTLFTVIHYILVGIFTGLVIGSEFENGLIRNALCLGKGRIPIYLSRFFSVSVLSVAVFTLYSVSKVFLIGYAEGFANLDWTTIIKYWVVLLPYYLAVAAAFTFFAFVARHSGVAVTLCIAYTILIFLLPGPYDAWFIPQFYVFAYGSPHPIFNRDFSHLLNGISVSAVHIAGFIFLGCNIFIKAEVK